MKLQQFVSLLGEDQPLTPEQQENVSRVVGLSRAFHSRAGISFPDQGSPRGACIVLESGHQPNFLPYPGIWKKVFLLDQIARELRDRGKEVIPLFCFTDQNLSTAEVLYRNHIPAFAKHGSRKIGFKPGTSKYSRFDCLEKPARDKWDRELSEIRDFYLTNSRKLGEGDPDLVARIDEILGMMDRCYQRAHDFRELNAFIFSRICQDLLDSGVHFYLSSDLQQEGLFSREWNRLLGLLEPYTTLHNRAVAEMDIGLRPLPEHQLPFWYHCSCNGKVTLTLSEEGDAAGTCETCGTPVRLPVKEQGGDLSRWLPRMSLSAVSRNMIFSEGLGTRLFLSGVGGSLQYGRVTNEISRALGFHVPRTLAWESKDYFLGLAHRIGLREIMRTFRLSPADLSRPGMQEKVRCHQEDLEKTIRALESDGKNLPDLRNYRNKYYQTKSGLDIVKQIFALKPSLLELLVQFRVPPIARAWGTALADAALEEYHGMMLLRGDAVYPYSGRDPVEIPQMYLNIAAAEMA